MLSSYSRRSVGFDDAAVAGRARELRIDEAARERIHHEDEVEKVMAELAALAIVGAIVGVVCVFGRLFGRKG